MVVAYIFYCIKIGARPCKYFQLNAAFFNREIGIFSKIDLDRCIPREWQLNQQPDRADYAPPAYPVFLKPEWGQNARGVHRADDVESLARLRRQITSRARYLIQECAREKNEYEIFSIREAKRAHAFAALSVTQVQNAGERFPINSVHNKQTRYVDITDGYAADELQKIWRHVRRLGDFGIARVSVCADSPEAICRGEFHVIEINLFLPMPINLLDRRLGARDLVKKVLHYMRALALATKHRDKTLRDAPVFIKSMLYHKQGALADFVRRRI